MHYTHKKKKDTVTDTRASCRFQFKFSYYAKNKTTKTKNLKNTKLEKKKMLKKKL